MTLALVVVRAFGARAPGDLIEDDTDIRAVLDGAHADYVVRVQRPASAKPAQED